jgi:hypothetical protein
MAGLLGVIMRPLEWPTAQSIARERISRNMALATGCLRIERVEERLKISVLDALKDDDLVVIFADELLNQR